MKGVNFPITKTKGTTSVTYNLSDPKQREIYFKEKIGREIEDIKEYLSKNTFVAYMMGKKLAGKGTYSKIFMEIFGSDSAIHISVGDVVRAADEVKADEKKMEELREYMQQNYRGYISLDDAFEAFLGRDTSKLLPTEFILALVKREIDKNKGKALFIDGFPRNMDQISYSLYFRQLIDYRNDPDIFIFIDLPEQVIDERIKYRAVCPKCQTSKNVRLNASTLYGYDEESKEVYLLCDNANCEPTRMLRKEGDDKGIELIRDRIEADDQLIRNVMRLYGVPKIYLRNSVPVDKFDEYCDTYERTMCQEYEVVDGKVKTTQKDWIVQDDDGIDSYSLYPAAVVVALIKQLHEVLIK